MFNLTSFIVKRVLLHKLPVRTQAVVATGITAAFYSQPVYRLFNKTNTKIH